MTDRKSRVRFVAVVVASVALACHAVAEIPADMSAYIDSMCDELELDTALCKAILLKENPNCDPYARHTNNNGTTDCGLWQLNDYYIWTFLGYWVLDEPFDIFDWRDNTYIALRHIRYLCTEFTEFDNIVMSYTCGVKAVRQGKIPDSTRRYLDDVRKNYEEIKHQ